MLIIARSHPVRVRGLKLVLRVGVQNCNIVAPSAGAWIETLWVPELLTDILVAPSAGAWIETYAGLAVGGRLLSHPVRVRGLKQK